MFPSSGTKVKKQPTDAFQILRGKTFIIADVLSGIFQSLNNIVTGGQKMIDLYQLEKKLKAIKYFS